MAHDRAAEQLYAEDFSGVRRTRFRSTACPGTKTRQLVGLLARVLLHITRLVYDLRKSMITVSASMDCTIVWSSATLSTSFRYGNMD